MRTRLGRAGSTSLVCPFAVWSALVLAGTAAGLHLLIDELVTAQLQDPAGATAARLTWQLSAGAVGALALTWTLLLLIVRRTGRNLDLRAQTDDLTELLNRSALRRRLAEVLRRSRSADGQRHVAVLFIDLDRFKAVNDGEGHEAGDRVLRQVSARLQRLVRPHDAVARFAGDEFVVILNGVPDAAAAEHVAARILEALREPLERTGSHRLTASIGMSVSDAADTDPDRLVRNADAAMYQAKSEGGDGYRVFDAELRRLVERRSWIDREVRGAAERGELHLDFQPFVALRGPRAGTVVAVEALLRWQHPAAGPISPGEFIPVAERNDALHGFGPWVVHEACRHLAHWQQQLPPHAASTVYVNLSPVELRPGLIDHLDECLAATGADPAGLGFEITETAILFEEDRSILEVLTQLRARGCRIAVDDFGTGYSSLSRLRTLPIDLLKLDASFVRSLTSSRRELEITTAVSRLAQRLGITVLAEGIETAEQLIAVRELGFDLAQGFHLARPAPATSVEALLTPTALAAGDPIPATSDRPSAGRPPAGGPSAGRPSLAAAAPPSR